MAPKSKAYLGNGIKHSEPEATRRRSGQSRESPKALEQVLERLSKQQKFCYGVGHIQNDLIAYAGFSYLLVFFTKVVGISSGSTGIIFLTGQVANSVLSPAVGYACDRFRLPCLARYGRRKAWHLMGVLIMAISLPFLFAPCLPCLHLQGAWVALMNYTIILVATNFGFTAIEISHLSLLPKIAVRPTDFVKLNSIRTAWMFVSGIFVYGLMWVLLGKSSGENLSHEQWREFMSLGFIISGVGIFFAVTFHVGTTEPKTVVYNTDHGVPSQDKSAVHNPGFVDEEAGSNPTTDRINDGGPYELNINSLANHNSNFPKNGISQCAQGCSGEIKTEKIETDLNHNMGNGNVAFVVDDEVDTALTGHARDTEHGMTGSGRAKKKGAKTWFRKPEFYTLCFVFMCVKVVINMSNSYFPLYLVDALNFEKEAIAYFPLIVLVSSSVFSYLAKRIIRILGNKMAFCAASVTVIGAYTWFYFQPISSKQAVYGASVIMGGGYSIMLVTMLTMVAEMINRIDKASGAFVYGAASLMDKLANGVTIAIIQEFYPKADSSGHCTACDSYIRHVFSMVAGVAAALALIVVLTCYKPRTNPRPLTGETETGEVCTNTTDDNIRANHEKNSEHIMITRL